MAGVWKRDGTIAVTKGSKKVVGTGTTFADPKNAAAKGHLLVMVTGTAVDLYEVDYSESNSVFYLVEAYRGDTGTGKAYAIDTSRTDSIPEFARRLNATLGAYQQQGDAFQALLTSDAATIEVTAPDGTKHTMIPWKRVTSEGEGQAARAKAEADKAASSAALAGSIVEASALPLPDVWAPLSDSLRMITGYGREVKVGDDVVARMVNFTRSTTATYIGKDGLLKNAAVNEARFEDGGLLIEGPSTNLVAISEGATFQTGNAGFQALTNNVSGVLPMTGQRISFASNSGESNANLIQTSLMLTGGQTYTYSAHFKVEAGDTAAPENCIGIYALNGVNIGARAVIRKTGDGIYRVSVPFTVSGTGSQQVFIRFNRIGSSSAVWTAVVGGVQVENLPFASSYIPTTGAAATRAADMCDIPNGSTNYRPAYNGRGPMTVALCFDVLAGDIQDARYLLTAENVGGQTSSHAMLAENSVGYRVNIGGLSALSPGKTVAKYAMDPSVGTVSVDGKNHLNYSGLTSSYQISQNISVGRRGVTNNGFLFGHVRNIRIYFSKLSAAQFEGVA